ncbi:MAG: ATPase [Chlamydiia bacterium]|nr:ATPase [Chlamydiia bacterium]
MQSFLKKTTSSLLVIKGRRRIGKSRLIAEFGKGMKALIFTGLPPEDGKTTAQVQRDFFAKQMELLIGIKGLKGDDWTDLFWHLAKAAKRGRLLIVFDEINWMGSLDGTFLGKLKSAWDLYFKSNPKLIMILSGSMSTWIETNILNSTGFMGRISYDLTLEELPLPTCNDFWREQIDAISPYEKFKVLSVTGGVPRYLEEINPHLAAEEIIYRLAFRKGALLVKEFDRIFNDLFSRRSHRYKEIVKCLAEGSADLSEIAQAIDMELGGTISDYLDDLVETGYVARDYTWNIKNGTESKLSKFRLKDNYIRFYLKYIEPKLHRIEKNQLKVVPAWTSIMGLQFENLVLNNIHRLVQLLNIDSNEIVYDSPYFQRPTKEHRGCQIDYMIQTQFNTLYVFEIKSSKDKIGTQIISELKDKITALAKPKNISYRPILIHVNGVTDTLIEANYFSHIIDFSQFLESN